MRTPKQRQLFFKKPRSNFYRILLWVFLIVVGIFLVRGARTGAIRSPFEPTYTPTRTGNSFAMEGDAHFEAGNLNAALTAYQDAVRLEPDNAELWSKLARIQTYSSDLLTTDAEQVARLKEAQISADKAVELAPESSQAHAIRAFTLDWNAGPLLYSTDPVKQSDGQKMLTEAEQEAVRALTLDKANTLALAFYAEILTDEQKLAQAESNIQLALESGDSLMDVHRVYAGLLESQGLYRQAIEEYTKAIAIAPNLTFLYLRVGAIYRHLQDYEKSLEYFAKAADLNEQLGIKDPIPYLSIAKTYSQQGEFFIAGRNVLKALSFDQANPDVYGQLGIVYFKSRNYEGSILPLKCALYGCTAEESCTARGGCDAEAGEYGQEVVGMPLSPGTVVYYYTYGSVLSALSRPKQNYCPEAMKTFGEVRSQFGSDEGIMNIVQAGEAICQNLGASINATQTTDYSTPTPEYTPAP